MPADLRVSRSSVTSSSEDLDGILFSRISTDKTPWAQRLTRPRPNGVPWLDLALVVPSPVDSRMSEDCKVIGPACLLLLQRPAYHRGKKMVKAAGGGIQGRSKGWRTDKADMRCMWMDGKESRRNPFISLGGR